MLHEPRALPCPLIVGLIPKRGAGVFACLFLGSGVFAVDLKNATITTAPNLTAQEKQAVTMLGDEIEKRTRIRLPVSDRPSPGPEILVGEEANLRTIARQFVPAPTGAEGYRVQTIGNTVVVAGNDPRGTLFGIGARCAAISLAIDRKRIPTMVGQCRCGSSTFATWRCSAPMRLS
jgi:hypothetical protein